MQLEQNLNTLSKISGSYSGVKMRLLCVVAALFLCCGHTAGDEPPPTCYASCLHAPSVQRAL